MSPCDAYLYTSKEFNAWTVSNRIIIDVAVEQLSFMYKSEFRIVKWVFVEHMLGQQLQTACE